MSVSEWQNSAVATKYRKADWVRTYEKHKDNTSGNSEAHENECQEKPDLDNRNSVDGYAPYLRICR